MRTACYGLFCLWIQSVLGVGQRYPGALVENDSSVCKGESELEKGKNSEDIC